ncbi:MAG TPA: hypothetical protein VHN20_15945 [Beijerinckiaceae bacterium]|nr:hypothetical protein [Beijerinckiaceae bacterium]
MTSWPDAEPRHVAVEPPWYQKLATLIALIFCFEVGVFLAVFPWITDWRMNYLAVLPFWHSPYLRGAISGVGLLNIYIALAEAVRLKTALGEPKRLP